MKPDGYLPRKGDVVVLHAKLTYDVDQNDTLFHAKVLNGQEPVIDTIYAPVAAIVDVHSFRFGVGDVVGTPRGGGGTIEAIKDGFAWVKHDLGPFETYALGNLKPLNIGSAS